jgi:hypothetical protein
MGNMSSLRRGVAALICAAFLSTAPPALAQFIQYASKPLSGSGAPAEARQGTGVAVSGDGSTVVVGGPGRNAVGAVWVYNRIGKEQAKLVGSGADGAASQGWSTAVSADGNTLIFGGINDGGLSSGAAWVFTRSGGVWTQQGPKLVGTGVIGLAAQQGMSVAISGDGNTAIVGGPLDNNNVGAAWVYTRSGGTWTQQAKLVGNGAAGQSAQGMSVALSADGNIALVGGPGDHISVGAAWVYTRSGSTWTQQGSKLVGSGGSPGSGSACANIDGQGYSVALSANGGTALIGAGNDGDNNSFVGAAWVFINTGSSWIGEAKLVGAGNVGSSAQGCSVALSADGNTAIVGGPADNNGNGAMWAFTRSGGEWMPLGTKRVGQGGMGSTPAQQGYSVALSGDSQTAVVGGPGNNTYVGGAWVFVKTGSAKANVAATHDFNADAQSDIAWRHSGGATAAWLMSAQNIVQAGGFGVVGNSWQIVGQRDFNNDGKYDWLWRESGTGTVAVWLLEGLSILQSGTLGAVSTNWLVAGTADFNYDGNGDILWRDSQSGTVAIWLMNGVSILQSGSLGAVPGNWTIAATDGKGNILWRDTTTGTVVIWQVFGLEILRTANLGAVPLNWTIAGVGDFDGNGSTDILWRDTNTGTIAIWLMSGYQILQTGSLGSVSLNWQIAEVGDFDSDRMSDILWYETTTGAVAMWFMNGLQVASVANVGTVGTAWTVQGLNAD